MEESGIGAPNKALERLSWFACDATRPSKPRHRSAPLRSVIHKDENRAQEWAPYCQRPTPRFLDVLFVFCRGRYRSAGSLAVSSP